MEHIRKRVNVPRTQIGEQVRPDAEIQRAIERFQCDRSRTRLDGGGRVHLDHEFSPGILAPPHDRVLRAREQGVPITAEDLEENLDGAVAKKPRECTRLPREPKVPIRIRVCAADGFM